ncbi:MAG TPA: hypothetical protein VGL91_19355 [Acidobacteriota bacterium]|jgi:hypothetical protein
MAFAHLSVVGRGSVLHSSSGGWRSQFPDCHFIDTEAVLYFPGPKPPDWFRKLTGANRFVASIDSERFSSVSRSRVQVNCLRLKAKVRSNPQSGIVDGKLANPENRPDQSIDLQVEFFEVSTFRDYLFSALEAPNRFRQNSTGDSSLVLQTLPAGSLGSARTSQSICQCPLDCEKLQLSGRGSPFFGAVVIDDGFKGIQLY